eukprot:839146-Alexandrium_andersonii.AAC.1
MHKVRAHGHTNAIATKTVTPWCPSCMMFFHTTRRTMRHLLQSAPRCKQAVLENVSDQVQAPYQAFLDSQAEAKKGKGSGSTPDLARAPAIRAQGPLPEWSPLCL